MHLFDSLSRSRVSLVSVSVSAFILAGCGGGSGTDVTNGSTSTSGGLATSSYLPTSSTTTPSTTTTSPSTTTGGTGTTPSTSPSTTPTAPAPAPITSGTLYHVRVDGGTATQCNGKADAAYPGSGTGQNCAWSGPMVALPPSGSARIAGGDALIIHPGQYKVGFGAPGADGCSSAYPWDCTMQPVPSGPDADHPTKILGTGYDTGCASAPQLWGNERAAQVVSLVGSKNVQMACVEITDHAPCVESHSSGTYACNRSSYPYGAWAAMGIRASDSSNVQLTDLNIHGLANRGVLAGRLKDWTLTRVRIAGNGWAGWDGDLGAGLVSSNSGTIKFSRVTVEWNGCGETYPGNAPTGCWGQSAGGYGDGVGTGRTGGNWVIEDSSFLHNVSDGLDLLYADGTGTVTLNRVRSEGNAGNQIKISGTSSITNTIAVGNCGFFNGKSFTYNVDSCRALGDAIALSATSATTVMSVVNSTILSQGNVIINTAGPAGSQLVLRNNVMIGLPYFFNTSYPSADTYYEGGIAVSEMNAVKQNLRSVNCATSGTVCGIAGVTNASADAFDATLLSSSPARDTGLGVGGLIPSIDFFGTARPTGAGVDRGAVEYK